MSAYRPATPLHPCRPLSLSKSPLHHPAPLHRSGPPPSSAVARRPTPRPSRRARHPREKTHAATGIRADATTAAPDIRQRCAEYDISTAAGVGCMQTSRRRRRRRRRRRQRCLSSSCSLEDAPCRGRQSGPSYTAGLRTGYGSTGVPRSAPVRRGWPGSPPLSRPIGPTPKDWKDLSRFIATPRSVVGWRSQAVPMSPGSS